MSDDGKDEPPPVEGLPPWFPMVEDGYEMVAGGAGRHLTRVLLAKASHW